MSRRVPTIEQLRRYAIARSLFAPTTLARAVAKLGFVQADPIRAPARAQDLILRHRVHGYHAGELEQRYPKLQLDEGFFVNYGFLPHDLYGLMHPRVVGKTRMPWTSKHKKRAAQLTEFIASRGSVHPREVDELFGHGRVENYWGGMSNATTHLLHAMHYRGLLRVARRDTGIRIYTVHEHPSAKLPPAERDARLDALIDLAVDLYAPLPSATLSWLVSRLRYGAPQWAAYIKPALHRARARLAHARVDKIDWFWPAGDNPASRRHRVDQHVRLFTPFDPVVWDRRRFELFWGWTYRFEAYTPVARRKLGYYALPLLWGEHVIGWANVSVRDNALQCDLGFVDERPRDPTFERELAAELARMRTFLSLP